MVILLMVEVSMLIYFVSEMSSNYGITAHFYITRHHLKIIKKLIVSILFMISNFLTLLHFQKTINGNLANLL